MRARGWTPATWWGLTRADRVEVLAYEQRRSAQRAERQEQLLAAARASETLMGWLAQFVILAHDD